MSLKRVLGLMLASRMASRGRRRGSLGTAAVLGGLGGRKLGVAALAYMAWRAYRERRDDADEVPGGSGGGFGGLIRSVADRFTGSGTGRGASPVGARSADGDVP